MTGCVTPFLQLLREKHSRDWSESQRHDGLIRRQCPQDHGQGEAEAEVALHTRRPTATLQLPAGPARRSPPLAKSNAVCPRGLVSPSAWAVTPRLPSNLRGVHSQLRTFRVECPQSSHLAVATFLAPDVPWL